MIELESFARRALRREQQEIEKVWLYTHASHFYFMDNRMRLLWIT